MKNKIEQEESLFKNLKLNEAREEGESYEDYKIRRKSNNHIIKLYLKHGRDVFKQAFPDGITNDSIRMMMTPDKGND